MADLPTQPTEGLYTHSSNFCYLLTCDLSDSPPCPFSNCFLLDPLLEEVVEDIPTILGPVWRSAFLLC